jgi:hypothetical protein
MKRFRSVYSLFALIAVAVLVLSNSGSAPQGYSGSPNDGQTCSNCHSGGNFGGSLNIAAPSTIMPSTSYTITVTTTKNMGSPVRAGFTLKSEAAGANVGTFSAGTGTTVSSGYVGHNPAKSFSGNTTVAWTFNWMSPASFTNGAAINFYAASVIGNGSTTNGDQVVSANTSGTFQGAVSMPLTVAVQTQTNVTCSGGNNGAVTVGAVGGSGCSYTYVWSNGQSGATATNLSPATYTVTATCGAQTGTASVTILQPPAIVFTSTSSQGVNCNNIGSASAFASGGTGNLFYNWSNGGTGASITVSSPGIYGVTATDGDNCKQSTTVNVSVNQTAPTVQIQTSGILSCLNNSVTLNNTVSNINYTYKWGTPGSGVIASTSSSYTVTQAGAYNVTVTNAATGCSIVETTIVQSNTSVPSAQIANANPTLTCTNSSIVLDASVSSGSNLSFQWSGTGITSGATTSKATVNQGGNFTVVVTDNSNGCSASKSIGVLANTTVPTVTTTGAILTCSQPSAAISANANPSNSTYQWSGPNNFTSPSSSPTVSNAGTYTVTTTGTNGCKGTSSVIVTEDKTPPNVSITGSATLCANQNVTLSLSGTSKSNIWSTNATTPTISVASIGTYSVTATGANGCVKVASKIITQAPQPIVTVKNDTLTCSKSSIKLNATTSSILGIKLWAGPSNFSDTSLTPTVTNTGVYTLTATTNLGCSAQFPLTIYKAQNIPQVTISGSPIICQGTVAILDATPNLGTYQWSNNTTNPTLITNQAGTYSVTATNAQGCKSSAMVTVVVSTIPTVQVADLKACEGANEQLKAVLSSPDTTVTYAWTSNNGYTGAAQIVNLQNITPNNTGKYYLLTTNQNGCVAKDTATVFVSPKMTTTLLGKVSCDSTATVTATTTGGISPFTYSWSGSSIVSNPLFIKAPITVILVLKDAYNCQSISLPLTVAAPTPITVTGVVSKQPLNNPAGGGIVLTVKGGASPFKYTWSDGSTQKDLVNVKAGKYCVTISDGNGCSKSECFEIKAESVGTADNPLAQAIRIFPNPSNDYLNIEIKNNVFIEKIQLFDDKGKLIQTFDKDARRLDLSNLPSAVYFLKLEGNEGFTMKRILKM